MDKKIIDPSLYVIYRLNNKPISTVLGATARVSVEFLKLEADPKKVHEYLEEGWCAHRFDKDFQQSTGEYIDV